MSGQSGTGKRILCVDDEELILTLYKHFFSGAGYDILVADSYRKGIELAKSSHIDILLSDGNLKTPPFDGPELVRVLREEHNFVNPVIFVTSGYFESNPQREKLAKRMNPYTIFPKPVVHFNDLISVVGKALAEQQSKSIVDVVRLEPRTENGSELVLPQQLIYSN